MTAMRTVAILPYLDGPAFTLTLLETGRTDWRGQSYIGYELWQVPAPDDSDEPIFAGEDFAGSPLHADDSDDTVRALLSFLTLREGDTDADYFDDYTERQCAFRDAHAESLSLYAMDDGLAFDLDDSARAALEAAGGAS